jgi:hypothetical protein
MPIFDNELVDNISNRGEAPKRPYLGSPDTLEVDVSLNPVSTGNIGSNTISRKGMSIDEMSSLTNAPSKGSTFSSPMGMARRSELIANQRYPLFERGVDLENVYGLQQSGLEQIGNGLAKMGAFALGTFGQSFATTPNTINAIRKGSLGELSNPNGYEASIDDWMNNMEDRFPNYVTNYERSRGLATAIPFTYGSANFWGNKILKNSGFMVGAIAGSIVQDAAVGFITGGLGEIPLVASQLGRASLYLNKLFAGTNKVDKVLDLARAAGKSEQALLNIQKLGQLAAATKLNNGFRYGMSIYGSARTEAAIESRETYRTIKEQLTEQYKLDNYGEEPNSDVVKEIEDYATNAMNTRFGINMALLTVSNAVQFDNIFKSFTGAQRTVTSSALKDFGSAGKIGLKEGTLDTFEKKIPQALSGKAWEFVKPKAINVFTEGVYEEGGQFATQIGVEDYYTRKYKAKGKESWDFVKETMSSTATGLAEQFGSAAGIESMVIGGITAAITGPVVDRITGKSKADNQRLNSTLNILNQYGMTGVLSNKYEDTSKSVEIAKQMNQAVNDGNIFQFKNLKSDMFFGFVNSRIPLGMHDVTIEQLEMLKDLPKDEFEKTFGMDFNSSNQSTVSSYVDALIQKANNINDISTSINSTFNNPYNKVIDPKTDDERAETLKHQMFENWKTDLANFSYIQQDSDKRIIDIQTAISKINPLLTNELLTLATSEKGLKELSDAYEQKANSLSESLSNLSPVDRTARRAEIKKLRTLSEKISLALNSKNIDPKLFNELVNFELNNQEFSPGIPFGNLRIDETTGLRDYAEDLNKINARKEEAAKQFDDLSTEKGFDKYFAEEEELQKDKENQGEGQTALFEEDEKFSFLNKSGKKETLEVDREYQIPNVSPAKVRKAGDQFKVTSPNGEVKYYDTREKAKEAADDLNVDFSELTTVKVIALNDDGTIKVEDLVGNIQNINLSTLKGYEKLQTEEEKLAKDKEVLDRELEKLASTGATVQTVSTPVGEYIGSTDKRKDVDILFLATTSPSEEEKNKEVNNIPHIKRARTFLNNFKFFTNRNKIKAILVTSNNAKALGLEGIIQLSNNKNIGDTLTEDETSPTTGNMLKVFITQTAKGDFFINEKGEKLNKVGDESSTILDNVVFQTMTSASLYTEGGYEKVRAGQEVEAAKALEAYKIFREDVFAQEGYTPYSFSISRGVPNQNVVNGVYEDNHIGDILGPNADKIIAEHNGLIEVSTTGKIGHNGELLSFKEGTTLIKFGDLLDFANNKVLTNKQASNVFAVIDALAKDLIAKSNSGQVVKPNYNYFNFLKNILYWKFKGDPTTPSQISIDTKTMEFRIGTKAFPFSKIQESKKEIMDALQDAFISVNNKTLSEGTSKKFTEYVVDKEGKLVPVVWKNYQSFLLASKNPDGSTRSAGETPLITHTAKPTDNLNSYKQKYSFITDADVLPYDRVPAKEAKPAPAATAGITKIGEYEVNTGKEETITVGSGPVLFTATLSPEGEINVEVKENKTTEDLSTNQGKIDYIDSVLTKDLSPEELEVYNKKLNEEKVSLFLSSAIRQTLEKEYQTQQAAPKVEEVVVQPMAPPEVVAQQDIEAKKADIEKRRQEELNSELDKKAKDIPVKKEYYKDSNGNDITVTTYRAGNKTFNFTESNSKAADNFEDLDLQSNTPYKTEEVESKLSKKINAKYDAELAALESGKEEAPADKPYDPSKKKRRGDAPEFRQVGKDSNDRMTNAELEMFKEWHAKNVPFIPFEILENIIKRGNVEAWGVFENGVAKFVRGGLRGTEYHEIFEAIYADFLTETEKNNLLTEFRNKKGEFTDRQSGKKIAYSDATDKQAKERIADDFADFRLGKLPARSLGEAVRNLFKKIMDFFKSFVSKPSMKNELFKAIDSGKFKETKLSERAKTLAPEYRAIEGLTEEQTNNYINDMVVQVSRIIFREGNKDALFNPEKLTGSEVFDKVREDYEDRGEIDALGEKRYNELVKRTIDSIRTRGISFNAEEVVSINDENANGKEYAQDTFSVDWKKHSTGALKFLLSTLAERKALNQSNVQKGTPLKPAEFNFSNEGYKLLNFNRVFATLLDRLHGTNDPVEFTNKFIQLAKEDSNYLPLFVSLGGNPVTHTFDFADTNKFKESDWKLFIQFFNTFTRQKPDALIQYISEEGDVHTGSANIFTTVKQTVDGWVDNMKVLGKAPGGLISYDKTNKVYKIDTVGIKALNIKKPADQIKFLNALGIEFNQGTYNALSNKEVIIKEETTSELSEFNKAVGQIQAYLGKNNELMTFDAKRLDIGGPLRTLAGLYTRVNNPNQDSTYFGVEGQRIGSFSENNAPSYFENTFNESKTLKELLEKMPQLNDVYSRGSEILKPGGLFFNEDGERIATITVGYIQGTKNELTGKDKSTAKLARGERFVQEMNQNINGNYYVLIPGDSSTEWMMNLGNVISMDDIVSGDYLNKVYTIYSNYLNDDINLALADRKQNIYQRARSQELRIMRDILPKNIVEGIENMIQGGSTYDNIQDYISKNREAINASVKSFIDEVSKETFDILVNSNQIRMVGEDKYSLDKFDTEFLKKYNLNGQVSFDEVMNLINFTNINYQINNQEYHKILFGDPYQFKTEKGKLDETKRIKSFLSGRRRTFDHPDYNNFLKTRYNSVDGIELDDKTPGYHDYKEYAKTVTFADVNIVGSIATLPNVPQEIKDAYTVDKDGNGKVNETDAFSILMDATHKEIALKEGQWSDQAEEFHQWHMAYTRRAFDKKGIKKYTSDVLKAKDAKLLESPIPKHKLAVRKPIISGNKNNKTEIDLVLDKTSQMPIYYHMVEDTSLGAMYEQMFDQNIGYGIFISGRKVGSEGNHDVYVDGKVNTAKFENIVEVPWKIYGTQVETMSEGEKHQTRGSQLTKLSSMDLYENGEPISEEGRVAYERNTKALDMLNENAYNELLKRLGVIDLGDTYALENNQIISETLMYEMMRRDLSENAKDTIQLDENGEFMMPFEASPSYIQIKNILYSMVNKALISPAMSGAPHVQAPVTMFEQATEGRSFARKTDTGWVKISKAQYAALTEEEKKSVMLTDDTLKFYEDEDGKRYCEVLLPHWFKNKFGNMTDDQILKYLNTTEGKKILTGIGFRIPTQALSSVEVFRVKGFLPQYMGYTVIVPSEITTKAGSDFDIDKLNIYLKSVYTDRNGNVKLVKWLGTEQATKDFFAKVYDDKISKDYINLLNIIEIKENRNNFFELVNKLENDEPLSEIDKKFYDEHSEVIDLLFDMSDKAETPIVTYVLDYFKNIDNIQESLIKSNNVVLKQQYINNMYKKSLENEYYDSLEELLTLPENFNRLITPVDDAGLEDIADLLDKKRGYNESNIKGRLINRNFMTNMRHAFITGKRWVGIAAVNITNLSLRQKSKVFLDPSKITSLSARERDFVEELAGEIIIALPHNTLTNEGRTYVSLSGTTTADGKQLISQRLSGYATAFVDIANKPFITKIIKSDTVVSTFMFLEAIGAGNTGIYFLNQPIIEKYLEHLDSIGSKSVMGKDNLEYIRDQFPTTDQFITNTSISVEQLLDNIQEYGEKGEFDQRKNAEQQLILNEFIKYKILADQLFSYTQSTNYDTTRFGSSDALLKKEWATFNTSNFNLISNVDDVLAKTFIGKQAELLSKSFASFGAIMKTELPEIKAYTIATLKKYATRKYMSSDDYEKIANLIKNSFIDYVIQNNTTMSNMIEPLLVNSETAVVNQLEQAKQKYPDMQILKDLIPVPGNREGSAKSIQLKANVKDAYSENLYVGMMREMRDTPELNSLYNNIVNVAILQGVGQSAISIRNIIPVEDYAAKIAPIIQQLTPSTSLDAFENGMFERNNISNKDVVTDFIPYVYTPEPDENGEYNELSIRLNPNTGEDEIVHFIPAFTSMKGVSKTSRRLLMLSDRFNSFQLSSDFLRIPKVITDKNSDYGKKINIMTGVEVTKADYAKMKQKGSQDLYDSYYYKKVYTTNKDKFGNPIPLTTLGTTKQDEPLTNYYYKLINVYGDGNRAVEYNTDFGPSVIDNGSMRIKQELNDQDIVNQFAPQIQEEVVPLPADTIVGDTIALRDGKTYNKSEVNSSMLEAMGYTPKEIGKILKSIC